MIWILVYVTGREVGCVFISVGDSCEGGVQVWIMLPPVPLFRSHPVLIKSN